MAILINGLIGAVIFGWAAISLYKSIKKQKAGKCAACALQKKCPTNICGNYSKKQHQ